MNSVKDLEDLLRAMGIKGKVEKDENGKIIMYVFFDNCLDARILLFFKEFKWDFIDFKNKVIKLSER